jgi:glycosyltransferase involved in cell wall biosynthesis
LAQYTMSARDWFELSRGARSLVPRRWFRGAYALAPFLGYLEEPDLRRAAVAPLEVSGWLFDPARRVGRLTVSVDGGDEVELCHGLARPDVERRFPGDRQACDAGFRGTLPYAGSRIEIFAYAGGARKVALAASLGAPDSERASAPQPPPPAAVRRRLDVHRLVYHHAMRGRLRAAFERTLARAAGSTFPRVAHAAPRLFEELCRGWREAGLSFAELHDALERRVDPPSFSQVRSNERRRLLFVCGMFPSDAHGGGLRLFDILQALSGRHEIDLYSVFREDLDGSSFERLRPRLHAARLVRSDELRAADVERWLARLGRRPGDYDVVQLEYPQSGAVAGAVRRWGRRSFFTMMECLTHASAIELDRALAEEPRATRLALVALVRHFALERDTLGRVHRGIAVTDADAEFAHRCFGGARPLVIPTCVSDSLRDELRPAAHDDARGMRRTAVFVGYFDHYPNRDALAWYLDRVHPHVLARVPDYRLRVVGRGELPCVRARFAAADGVDWVGAVEHIAPELRAARVGLAPMVSGAGIRGKINQYAAAGRPCVATSVGALGLPYRHEDSILISDDAAAFTDATVRLLVDDPFWHRLAVAARAVVDEQLRWNVAIAHLESLYAG